MKRIIFYFLIFLISLTKGSFLLAEEKEEKWKGLDEAVIEKVAEERGRKAQSLFELEGDLELFVFSLFSGISGFIAGYYWRKLLYEEALKGKNAPSPERESLSSPKL